MVRWFKVIRSALQITGGRTSSQPGPTLPDHYGTDTNTAVRQTLNNTHITSAVFPTRTAPELLPADPVVEDVGPVCDGDDIVLAALVKPLKLLDGIPVGGADDPVGAPSVGPLPALGVILPDSVTVGTLREDPYTAHS